jgi:hypothetical protein
MVSSKKIDLKRDFAGEVYLSEAHYSIPPTSLHTIRVQYSHREGRGREG